MTGSTNAAVDTRTLDPQRWVGEHGNILFKYAMARVHNREVAEDLVQEAMLAALKSAGSFKGNSTERTWLVGILKHKLLDYLRKAGRERASDTLDDRLEDEFFDDRGRWKIRPAKWTIDPHEALKQDDFRVVFEKCLEAAPERLARVFVLRELDELESNEICKILDVSSTNLWVMLHRARLKLRQCLENNWLGSSDTAAKSPARGS
jgi:RNA polymerase sigma-70 factor (TIGR02943 family)